MKEQSNFFNRSDLMWLMCSLSFIYCTWQQDKKKWNVRHTQIVPHIWHNDTLYKLHVQPSPPWQLFPTAVHLKAMRLPWNTSYIHNLLLSLIPLFITVVLKPFFIPLPTSTILNYPNWNFPKSFHLVNNRTLKVFFYLRLIFFVFARTLKTCRGQTYCKESQPYLRDSLVQCWNMT